MTSQQITDAIARSISHDEVVFVRFDPELCDELDRVAEWMNVGNDEYEYGGTSDGYEWRVHVKRPEASRH